MTDKIDRIVSHPRGKKVTIEVTAKQAETLWMLLDGIMCRDQFYPNTMRTISNIGKRVSKTIDAPWNW